MYVIQFCKKKISNYDHFQYFNKPEANDYTLSVGGIEPSPLKFQSNKM